MMPVQLVNQSPRYGKAHLIEPAPLGYLHLAADLEAAHRPGPVLRRSRDKQQLFGVLKWQARKLAQLEAVQTVTVYDALGFTPPGGDTKGQAARLRSAWFDVVILVETASPDAARDVRATPAYQELAGTLTERARRVHEIAARNVRRVGDVDKSRPGLFVFNYLVGDDLDLAVELWEYLSGWYAAETGLDSATLLAPLEGEQSDYVLINHARWDGSLAAFAARQLPKKTFRSYLLANLKANHVAAMPVLYRLALPDMLLAISSDCLI
jgi:hypothetical protein